MSKPYDATTKTLLETRPADWLSMLGYAPAREVVAIDADVSTVTAATDKVLRIGGRSPWLLHLEFESGAKHRLASRILKYNVLVSDRHHLPVRSVVVLLHPRADRPALTGTFQQSFPDSECYLEFRYRVVRVWQVPVEAILAGGLGTLALAPVSDVQVQNLPAVIRRVEQRFRDEVEPTTAAQLMTATFVLAGLRVAPAMLVRLFEGVFAMKESSAYQLILAEGRAEGMCVEARKFLLRLGQKRFGAPDTATLAALEAITDPEQLEQLGERIETVTSWHDLLAAAPRKRGSRRKK